jgi:hypothetical protein
MAAYAQLKQAVIAALAGDWERAHQIAQDYEDPLSNWIHAVLHKIEGDAWNSRYWYARAAGKHYEDYQDATEELQKILSILSSFADADGADKDGSVAPE